MKKVFLQPLFGEPYPWTNQYLWNIGQVEGFEWKIFTPHKLYGAENTEIIRMSLDEFNCLLEKKTGIHIDNVLEGPAPRKNLTDYYPAYGHIFEEYIEGYDYWGHQNWDIVNGRLSHFLPDDELKKYDIWADEAGEINGTFSLYRNAPMINHLYTEVEGWQEAFREFKLFGFDEMGFSRYVQQRAKDQHKTSFFFGYPPHYPFHSYDRMPQHRPEPKLELRDGRLYELFQDFKTGRWTGKEIMWFHFSYIKRWPIL